MKKILITLNDDGSISVDARGMTGKEAEILSELKSLAATVGGDFEVEKHVGNHHHHHGENDHVHE